MKRCCCGMLLPKPVPAFPLLSAWSSALWLAPACLLKVCPHLCQVLPPLPLLPLRRILAPPAVGGRHSLGPLAPARLGGAGGRRILVLLRSHGALGHGGEHAGGRHIGGGGASAAGGVAAAVAAGLKQGSGSRGEAALDPGRFCAPRLQHHALQARKQRLSEVSLPMQHFVSEGWRLPCCGSCDCRLLPRNSFCITQKHGLRSRRGWPDVWPQLSLFAELERGWLRQPTLPHEPTDGQDGREARRSAQMRRISQRGRPPGDEGGTLTSVLIYFGLYVTQSRWWGPHCSCKTWET